MSLGVNDGADCRAELSQNYSAAKIKAERMSERKKIDLWCDERSHSGKICRIICWITMYDGSRKKLLFQFHFVKIQQKKHAEVVDLDKQCDLKAVANFAISPDYKSIFIIIGVLFTPSLTTAWMTLFASLLIRECIRNKFQPMCKNIMANESFLTAYNCVPLYRVSSVIVKCI